MSVNKSEKMAVSRTFYLQVKREFALLITDTWCWTILAGFDPFCRPMIREVSNWQNRHMIRNEKLKSLKISIISKIPVCTLLVRIKTILSIILFAERVSTDLAASRILGASSH